MGIFAVGIPSSEEPRPKPDMMGAVVWIGYGLVGFSGIIVSGRVMEKKKKKKE